MINMANELEKGKISEIEPAVYGKGSDRKHGISSYLKNIGEEIGFLCFAAEFALYLVKEGSINQVIHEIVWD